MLMMSIGFGAGIATYNIFLDHEKKIEVDDSLHPKEDSNHDARRHGHFLNQLGWPSLNNIKEKEGYIASYNRRTRIPDWVYEHISHATLAGEEGLKGGRQNCSFEKDSSVPSTFQVHPKAYYKSGYDRGHLVPARDMNTTESLQDSFCMSNICPQVGKGFNRDYWRHLEIFVRHLATSLTDLPNIHVLTGPLFLPQRVDEEDPDAEEKGDDALTQKRKTRKVSPPMKVSYPVIGKKPKFIAVPTHFFKVLLILPRDPTEQAFITGFVLPNAVIAPTTPLTSFLMSIDEIEHYSGLEIFRRIRSTESVQENFCQSTSKCQLVHHHFHQSVPSSSSKRKKKVVRIKSK